MLPHPKNYVVASAMLADWISTSSPAPDGSSMSTTATPGGVARTARMAQLSHSADYFSEASTKLWHVTHIDIRHRSADPVEAVGECHIVGDGDCEVMHLVAERPLV